MAQKKGARASSDHDDLSRAPLQAVLLADSFATNFRPITLERPKVLLPLVNVPMIEYSLAWLESVGVEEVFVFCCAHSGQVKDYLDGSQWTKQPATFSVTTIESHDAISAGDALRVIYHHGVLPFMGVTPEAAELETDYYKSVRAYLDYRPAYLGYSMPPGGADDDENVPGFLNLTLALKKLDKKIAVSNQKLEDRITVLEERVASLEKERLDAKRVEINVAKRVRDMFSYQFALAMHKMEKQLRAELNIPPSTNEPLTVIDINEAGKVVDVAADIADAGFDRPDVSEDISVDVSAVVEEPKSHINIVGRPMRMKRPAAAVINTYLKQADQKKPRKKKGDDKEAPVDKEYIIDLPLSNPTTTDFAYDTTRFALLRSWLSKNVSSAEVAGLVPIVKTLDSISCKDLELLISERGWLNSEIRGDFVLISGDTVSNMSLTQALHEHKERRKKDPLAVMTMVIKHSKPSSLTHQTRLGNDEITMAIDPETKELLYYEDKADYSRRFISLDRMLLADNHSLCLHNDKQDCYIDICSPEVLSLFTDNFDYQHLRRHFVKGLLVDDIMGYKIFTHEIHSSYAARVDNFRSYDTISKDIMQRWTYPLVPDVQYFGNCSGIKLDRQGVYKAPEVTQSRSAQICPFSFVGSGTSIGDHSCIFNSVIGQGCTIGRNVSIHGSYIWDNVTIEDDCEITYALACDGVHLSTGAVLEPGVILSFKVEVGQKFVVPSYSKVSLLPQPSKQDSDEELEYADTNIGVIDSPSITSMSNVGKVDLLPNSSDREDTATSEVGIAGVGYIWSACEAGLDEEWRHSIAPIPVEKINEFFHNAPGYLDESNQDVICFPTSSGELVPDSESVGFDDGDDYKDSAEFEKEVEATFRRALTGVKQDNVIIEINSLRLSYNMSHADCAGALFYSILKTSYDSPHLSQKELRSNTEKEIDKWKELLKNYLKTKDEEIEVIMKFEEMCLESMREFSPFFTAILNVLYEKDIVSEDAILTWAKEKEGADESDKIFVKQAEPFITWLREAPEEEEEEE